jgi:putative resolvase
VVIAHKERLVRFRVELIQHLCHVYGTTLLILNTERLSPEPETVQDLLGIFHCFSAQLSNLSNYRKTRKKALADAPRTQNPTAPNP